MLMYPIICRLEGHLLLVRPVLAFQGISSPVVRCLDDHVQQCRPSKTKHFAVINSEPSVLPMKDWRVMNLS